VINTKQDIKRYLAVERKLYLSPSRVGYLKQVIAGDVKVKIFRFVKLLRKEEYYHRRAGLVGKLCYYYYHCRRNRLGTKLGLEMWDSCFDEGLYIAHAGNIVVNGKSRIGKNCILHGSNCIGNDGKSSACPVIGDNVRIGVGAKILGGVTLADDIKIGAGAVVLNSFDEPGITIAGVPARRVR